MNKIAVILPIFLAIGGAAIGIYAAANPEEMMNFVESVGEDKIAFIMPITIIAVVGIIMITAFMPLIKGAMANSRKKEHLMKVGQKAMAKVLSVQDTGITVNNNPYIKVTVEIKPGMQATFTMMMSRLAYIRPGDSVEVLYDPADPTQVMPATG